MMTLAGLGTLPGADLVQRGVADLDVGKESAEALLVSIGAPRTLSKAERGHVQDHRDIRQMVDSGLVDPADARAQFNSIEPELYRFPAIDSASFRKAVEEHFG